MEGKGIVARMGGKTLLKKKIVDLFPKDYEKMIYIEPFVGGGNILFYKNPSVKEVINDLDKNLILVYKGFKKYNIDDIKHDVNRNYSKEIFEKIRNSKPKSEYGKFIRMLILFRTSFYAKLRNYSKNKDKISLRKDYGERLKDVIIMNTDYKKVINKYNTDNTLLYLDPPYENSNKSHYENFNIDFKEMKNILDNFKGKFILSINDSKNIREIFKDYKISTIKTKYADAMKGGHQRIKTELIIKNY